MASVQFSDTASVLSFESASSATSTTGLLPMGSASNTSAKATAGTNKSKSKIPGHRRFRTISTAFLTKNNLAAVSTVDLPATINAAAEGTSTGSQKRKRGLSFARKAAAETHAHKKSSGASGAPSESTSTSYMAVLEAAWNRKRKMKRRASLPNFKPAQPVDPRAELLESGLDEVTLEAIGIRLDEAEKEKENRA
ncbi:hypothetical protein MKEN_00984800 [Mycena kentingensis (nom. inval.)]|nr:hypothetical protein MKEN_00984800 [Mycena kentingensis (nom. inval.)]